MAVGVKITDNTHCAEVYKRNGDTGLKVFTDVLHERTTQFKPVVNPDFGIEMAIDAAFSGTPDAVHNGIDSVLWTGTELVGNKTTFDSTDQAFAGTRSVKTDNAAIGDVYQFDKGSDLTIADYSAISMKIYVDKDWTVNDEVQLYFWDTGTSTQISDAVNLSERFEFSTFDEWQSIAIEFSEFTFSGTTFDAIRIEQTAKAGKAPKYYLDVIQIEESSGSEVFSVEPESNTKLFVTELALTFVDALDTTLTDNSMSNLSYNKVLGLTTLANGVLFRTVKDEVTTFSFTFRQLGDALRFGGSLQSEICDGTNTLITISIPFAAPTLLDSRDRDRIDVVISDDLSGLLSFTAVAIGQEQKIT